jgi:hypothetical protein
VFHRLILSLSSHPLTSGGATDIIIGFPFRKGFYSAQHRQEMKLDAADGEKKHFD